MVILHQELDEKAHITTANPDLLKLDFVAFQEMLERSQNREFFQLIMKVIQSHIVQVQRLGFKKLQEKSEAAMRTRLQRASR